MRRVSVGTGEPLKINLEQRSKLREWLLYEHRKAVDSRHTVEEKWKTALRMYQGDAAEKRWLPFEGAPHIEVTVGAQACDTIYAQAMDLITQARPPVTVRSRKTEYDDHADAVQVYVDWGVASGKFNFFPAVKAALLDDIQLGTMVGYIPWTKTVRKTDIRRVESFGPYIYALPLQDFIVPTHATKDIQRCKFATMRLWMSKTELNLQGRMNNWNIDDAGSSTALDGQDEVGSTRRKAAGLTGYGDGKTPYAIGDTYCYFDIDGDGEEEDLEVIWNMTTGGILKVMYNKQDCRPFELECYQDRAHVVYGLGVMEAMFCYEQEQTELHNNYIWNLMIANTKMYQGPEAMMQEMTTLIPGMYLPNDTGEIKPIDMGTTMAAPVQAQIMAQQMGEKRVGVQELAAPSRLGGRTPGITALSALQQQNRRFTPQFDNMRTWCAKCIIQCLYRLQEQLKGKNRKTVEKALEDILGPENANLLIALFVKSDIELTDALDIELTAASVSVNRESDRQNMVMLMNLFQQYAQGMAQLAQIKAQPPFPGADAEADKAAKSLNKLMRKVLKTFDQVADPHDYLITLDEIQAGQQPQMPPELQALMGGGGQAPGGGGGGPQQGPPPGIPLQ